VILDSTFLVDFEREKKRRSPGPASFFLKDHQDTHFCITFTILGELAAGKSLGAEREAWIRFIQPFRVLESSQEVAWQFGVAFRDLQAQGNLIGANDLWIAATGIAHNLPVVTRNAKDFGRVHGLTVIPY